jgi:hypothetical protein
MTLTIKTQSGSTYELDMTALKMRRVQSSKDRELRRDGEWVGMLLPPAVTVGAPLCIALEPLAPDCEVTMRITTDVVSIEED